MLTFRRRRRRVLPAPLQAPHAVSPLPSCPTLQLEVGLHVLREDVPEVLGRAAGRELEAAEMAALVKTFVLDTSAAISWREFERSWAALQALLTTPAVPARAAARGKHAVLAAATAAAAHQAARSIEVRGASKSRCTTSTSSGACLCWHTETHAPHGCAMYGRAGHLCMHLELPSNRHAIHRSTRPDVQPRTGAAEIGFAHAGAPLPAKQRNESISDRYVPLKTSDVTREGNRYFGMWVTQSIGFS